MTPLPEPLQARIQAIVDDYTRRAWSAGLPPTVAAPAVTIRSTPVIATYDTDANSLVLAEWATLPAPVQATFSSWASDAGSGWDGPASSTNRFTSSSFRTN